VRSRSQTFFWGNDASKTRLWRCRDPFGVSSLKLSTPLFRLGDWRDVHIPQTLHVCCVYCEL